MHQLYHRAARGHSLDRRSPPKTTLSQTRGSSLIRLPTCRHELRLSTPSTKAAAVHGVRTTPTQQGQGGGQAIGYPAAPPGADGRMPTTWLPLVGVQRGTRAPDGSAHPPSWLTVVGWRPNRPERATARRATAQTVVPFACQIVRETTGTSGDRPQA